MNFRAEVRQFSQLAIIRTRPRRGYTPYVFLREIIVKGTKRARAGLRCVTFSWHGAVYCTREQTGRTKKEGSERLRRVLSSAAAKGTRNLCGLPVGKEKKN